MGATDWDEVFPAGQYGFGRAGFVQFDNFDDAKNEALLYHDVEYIVELKHCWFNIVDYKSLLTITVGIRFEVYFFNWIF